MIIETIGLTKRFHGFTALHDCDLAIKQGEVFGLLGPNGAGKTTLLRLLMGYLRPTSGRATVDGLDAYAQRTLVHRKVSYLPGDVRLYRRMKGLQLLKFFSSIRPDGDFRQAQQMAERLQLDLARRVAYLSTGMRQKLALAATLSTNSPVLILDEPTSNLDPNIRKEVALIVKEARRKDRTVLFSSHVLSEVEDICDRVAILRSGKLVAMQTMSQLRQQHRIQVRLSGPKPPLPAGLGDEVTVSQNGDYAMTIDTSAGLASLLGYLGTLSVEEIRIEPMGLQRVYEKCQNGEDVKEPASDQPLK